MGDIDAPGIRCPPATDDFWVINVEGQRFHGYAEFGGGGPEALYGQAGRVIEQYRKTKQWVGSLRELRGALFCLLRYHRWQEVARPTKRALREFESLYDTIRARWDEGGAG